MAEPFFRMMEFLGPSALALNGNRRTFNGLKNIPERGGALVALNQRIWPKDHSKNLSRRKIPITVAVGTPLPPLGNVERNTALRRSMNTMLYRVQEEYPHPEGAYWVPRRLAKACRWPQIRCRHDGGGSAPVSGAGLGECG